MCKLLWFFMVAFYRWSQGYIPLSMWCHSSAQTHQISNYWDLGVEWSVSEHTRHSRLSPATHLHNTRTAHKTSRTRPECPIAHIVTHKHTCTSTYMFIRMDAELIKRFPEGSQERQATVETTRNLPLWPKEPHQTCSEIKKMIDLLLSRGWAKVKVSTVTRTHTQNPKYVWKKAQKLNNFTEADLYLKQ